MNIKKIESTINSIINKNSQLNETDLIDDIYDFLDYKYADSAIRFRDDIDKLKDKIYNRLKSGLVMTININASLNLNTEIEKKFVENAINKLINEDKINYENKMLSLKY